MKFFNEIDYQFVDSDTERVGVTPIKKTLTIRPRCADGFTANEKITLTDDMLRQRGEAYINYLGTRKELEGAGLNVRDVQQFKTCFKPLAGGVQIERSMYPSRIASRLGTSTGHLTLDLDTRNAAIAFVFKIKKQTQVSRSLFRAQNGDYVGPLAYIHNNMIYTRYNGVISVETGRSYLMYLAIGKMRIYGRTGEFRVIVGVLSGRIIGVFAIYKDWDSISIGDTSDDNIEFSNFQKISFRDDDELSPTAPLFSDDWYLRGRGIQTGEQQILEKYDAYKPIIDYSYNIIEDLKGGCA